MKTYTGNTVFEKAKSNIWFLRPVNKTHPK